MNILPNSFEPISLKRLASLNPYVSLPKSGAVDYVPMENIHQGYLDHQTEEISSLPSSLNAFSEGDILLAKVTPCFENGNIAIASNLLTGVGLCSTELFVLRIHSDKILPEYLMLLLQDDQFKKEAKSYMRGTGGLKRIPTDWLMSRKFLIPSLKHQRLIIQAMSSSDSLIQDIQKGFKETLDRLSSYRQSLITRAVTKGLDPNVEMKASGVQWIGNMPSHWRICRVKNLFSVVCGATPSPNPQYWNGNINWIGPSDMDEIGDVSSGKRSITREGYESCGTTLVPQGSLVLSTRAPVGKVNIAKGELCTNQGCKSLVPLGSKNYTKYYYFVLQAAKDQLIQDSSGTTFLELSTSALSDELLPLPSLDEQKRIVSFLEKIDEMVLELKVKLSDSIRLLNEYRSSLISAAVTGQLAIDEEASA